MLGIVIGKQIVATDTLPATMGGYQECHIDLGCGDGKYIGKIAEAHPHVFCLGIDAVAANVAETSRKRRKQANLAYARAGAESLPESLHGTADRVSVILPWGSLMLAVGGGGGGNSATLGLIARLLKLHGTLEVVLNLSVYQNDPLYASKQGLDDLPDPTDKSALQAAYARVGLTVIDHRKDVPLPQTRWGRQLHRQRRQAVGIVAKIAIANESQGEETPRTSDSGDKAGAKATSSLTSMA